MLSMKASTLEEELADVSSGSFQLNSHIIDFDVAVVRGGDQELGVRGESEGPDGHGVT